VKHIQFNDHERAIDITAQIKLTMQSGKVVTGTYSGFSIGGK